MKNDKVLSLLGLAKKAGKLKSGEFQVEEEIKRGRAKIVLVANDASDNTKKKYSDMCAYRHISIHFYADKDTLGRCIGCEERAAVVVIDEGFAKGIESELNKSDTE